MSKKTIRVAVTLGNPSGAGKELVMETLKEQELQEMCPVVIYDSPQKALEQGEDHEVMVVVDGTEKEEAPLPMLVNDRIRVAVGAREAFEEKAEILHKALRRDFRISNPRIAMLTESMPDSEEDKQANKTLKETLETKKINVFGPYSTGEFMEERRYETFDAVIVSTEEEAQQVFSHFDEGNGVRFAGGRKKVFTSPVLGNDKEANANALRHAVYLGIDICRNREDYDEPLQNPLKKLYHERKDDSEKVRFNIPKKKDTTDIPKKKDTTDIPKKKETPAS